MSLSTHRRSIRTCIDRKLRAACRSMFQFEPMEKRVLLAANISGAVFNDYNANGIQDAGEPGLAGWTVFIDANNNSIPDTVEPKRTTDANGFYKFENLATPAQYILRVVIPVGWQQTRPGSGGVILRDGDGGGNDDGRNNGGGAGGLAEPGGARPYSSTEIVVAFQGNHGMPALQQRVKADPNLGRMVDVARSRDWFQVQGTSLVEVKLPAGVDAKAVADRFAALPGVAWAQPNYIYDDFDPRELTPNDPLYGSQYHHTLMQNNLAWDITMGSPNIVVAVTDDGVLLNHPDLAANIWVNTGEIPGNGIDDDGNGYIDDVNGWNFWNNNNNPNPASGANDHGTHVAGIIAAKTNNGIGVAGTAGNVTIMPIRFYSSSGGSWTSTVVSNSYRYAADNGAHIMNTSYNVDGFSNDQIFAAGVQYMYDKGVLHFNSAGNNGQLNPSRQRWDQTLFVVNTTASDTRNSGSNYGWGVDITAPGTNILSTSMDGSGNPNYENKSGTSMAAPNAAAVAALIWSHNPTWTREQVVAQLLGSADDISAQNPSIANLLGAGRVNSFRALTETIKPPKMKVLTGLPNEGAFVTVKPNSFTLDTASLFEKTTMNLSNFELRGAGLDGIFGTSDDVLVPMTLGFGSPVTQNYMVGTNRLQFTIPGQMPPDTYRFSALPGLTDPFGQPLDGNGDGVGGDAFTRTFTLLPITNRYVVNLTDGVHVTNADFGNHDIAPPRPLDSSFAYATAHAIVVQFNEDVSASLDLSELSLQNLTTNQPVSTAGFTLSWDSATNTATYNVNGILPDGRFRATFSAASIQDLSGNNLDGNGNGVGGDDLVVDFLFLLGDANNDGIVNLVDFNILAENFGQSGRNYTQGDFNYDGTVNLEDFNILAQQFGVALPSLATTSSASSGSIFSSGTTGDRDGWKDDLLA